MIFYGLTVRQWHYNNTKRKNSILWQCLLNLLITRLITIQMLSRPFIMFIFLVSSVSGQNEVTNYIITIKQEESAKYLCQTSSSPKREKPFNNCKQSQAWAASFLITRRLNLFFFSQLDFLSTLILCERLDIGWHLSCFLGFMRPDICVRETEPFKCNGLITQNYESIRKCDQNKLS